MKTRAKSRAPKELRYSAAQSLDFTAITLGASILSSVVQARFPLGLDYKIFRATVVLGGTAAGTCSFNIVAGEGAEGSTMVDDTSDFGAPGYAGWTFNSASGTKMFAADQVVTMTVGSVQSFTPAFPDGIWQQGTELTLRLVTNASATTGENLTVVLYGFPVDTKPTKPMASTTTPAAFNFATDV